MTLSSIRLSIDRLDRMLGLQVLNRQHPRLAAGFARLSNAANHSKLWVGIAGLQLMLGGRRGRRAALRGLLSVAMSSAVANGVLKPIMPRTRPPKVAGIPVLVRRPLSSSFPSGHAASAAAIATATAMEQPQLAVPVAALAAAVAASRVSTGVHHTSDIIAGAAIGAAIAGATALVWPLVEDAPAEAPRVRNRCADRAVVTGVGMTVITNVGAGKSDPAAALQPIEQAFPDARIVCLDEPAQLADCLERHARSAKVLGAVGGDGTVNAAARVALGADVPLAVFPGGTLNHFARDLGIETIEDTIDAVQSGNLVEVDTATIADQVFLNTASFGSYCDFVAHRQRFEQRLGKWMAAMLSITRLLLRGAPATVTLDGVPRRIWMIFIGNCAYDPAGFAPASRAHLDDGLLDVRIIDASAPAARLRLVTAMAVGRLEASPVYERSLVAELHVVCEGTRATIAVDGELIEVGNEFVVRKGDARLHTYVAAT